MREILFRGKSTDTGAWVYGYYCGAFGDFDEHEICDIADPTCSRVDVDPETIGQYTGLTDKNGKQIFEGDIVRDTGAAEYRLLSDRRKKPRSCLAIVKYGLHDIPSDDPFCWGMALGFYLDGETVYPTLAWYKPYYEYGKYEIEVIGNIHDNPELIGGKEDGT